MIDTTRLAAIGLAAFTSMAIAVPQSAQAQNLDITCNTSADTATNLCDDDDMADVEDFVNSTQNDLDAAEVEIDANTDLINRNAADQAVTDAAQDQALADAVADQTVTDAAQDAAIAQNAEDITDLDTRVTDNEEDIATNAANIETNTTNIQANTDNIAINATNIQTNTDNIQTNADNIATNAEGIAQNAADISDLRTDLNRGLAMANAMEVFAPDPGSDFRMNIGTGFHDGEAAFGITGAGRIGATGNTVLYFGIAGAEGTTGGKAGISFQW